jgi:hypothetical protein
MSLINFFKQTQTEEGGDPLVRLMLDRNVIQLSSTLIAKLEYIRYDSTRRGVFKTKWCRDMFQIAVIRLSPEKLRDFDIDAWYAGVVARYAPEWKDKFDVDPSKFSQTVDTNWMLHLLEMENQYPGFMLLLHNCLDLEDSTHNKMAEKSKKEDEYDFLGVGDRNKATQLLLGHQEAHRARLTSK